MATALLVLVATGSAVASPLLARNLRVLWERPVWAVVLTVALVAVPLRTGPATQSATHVTPADIGGVVLVILAATRGLLQLDRERLRAWPVLPVMVLGAAILISGALAPGGPSISGTVRYGEIFCALPLATYVSIRERADLELVVRSFLLLALGEGIVGIFQFVTRQGAGIGGQTVRAVGTFGSYDVIAMSKVVAVGLMAALALQLGDRALRRRTATLAAAVLVVALAMSLSRGSWVAAIVGAAALLVVHDRQRAVRYLVLGVVLLSLAVAVQGHRNVVVRRFESLVSTGSSPDQSVRDRYALWSAAVGIWEAHPVTGVGPREFATYRDSYVPVSFSGQSYDVSRGHYQVVQLLTPHNLYLLLFAELGAFGGLTYGWLLLTLVICTWLRSRHRPDDVAERSFLAFALGMLVVVALTGVTGDIGGPTTVLDALMLGCGLVAAAPPSLAHGTADRQLVPVGHRKTDGTG